MVKTYSATQKTLSKNKGPNQKKKYGIKKKTLKKKIDPVRKQNIQTVLKMLAASGETGVLSKSISDKTDISPLDTANALTYLTEKKYAELINSTNGKKYYLTDLGRRYCINKQFI